MEPVGESQSESGAQQPVVANRIDLTRARASLTEQDPRVLWAAERTALAWLRTGLGIIAFGFVLARAPAVFVALGAGTEGAITFPIVGVVMILAGAAAGLDGSLRYLKTFRRLSRGELASHSPRAPLIVAGIVGALAVAIAAWVAVTMA